MFLFPFYRREYYRSDRTDTWFKTVILVNRSPLFNMTEKSTFLKGNFWSWDIERNGLQ